MVKGTLGSDTTTLATLRKSPDGYGPLVAMLESLYLSGAEIDWNEYHRDYPSSQRVVELPRYAWDLKRYWIDYRNDFCLLKGEKLNDPITSSVPSLKQIPQFKYISPAVQRVIEETHGSEESQVIIESDIFDERLLPVLQGHLVNGAALCPSVSKLTLCLTSKPCTELLNKPNSHCMLTSLSHLHISWSAGLDTLSKPPDSMCQA